MSRSKPSYERTKPLEFLLDRSLGRGVAEDLFDLGWVVHRIVAHFPNDAAEIADEEWLAYGFQRGWTPLCKDGRIKGRAEERRPLELYGGVLFYLDNQQLLRAEMVRRFHQARSMIERCVHKGGPAAYAVRSDRVERTWP